MAINGRDGARLAAATATLAPSGEVFAIQGDVADERDAERIAERAAALLGRIDVLVHCAGIDGAGLGALELTADGWRRVIDANLTGPFLVARATARRMVESGGGAMVLVASLNGLAAEPHFADYNASKGGVVMLVRSLALDLLDRGIRVNGVCPGYILTPMTEGYAADPQVAGAIRAAIPMARFGEPSEVAAAIAFLASDDASYIAGELLVVDGGRNARQ